MFILTSNVNVIQCPVTDGQMFAYGESYRI